LVRRLEGGLDFNRRPFGGIVTGSSQPRGLIIGTGLKGWRLLLGIFIIHHSWIGIRGLRD